MEHCPVSRPCPLGASSLDTGDTYQMYSDTVTGRLQWETVHFIGSQSSQSMSSRNLKGSFSTETIGMR